MERYLLQESTSRENWLVCTDTANGIVCLFERHAFNETQEFTFLEDSKIDALEIARLMREMADWLHDNHYNEIFP